MYVVQRKLGQSILLDEGIEITVTKIGESSIKLGINAPKEVRIRRAEDEDIPQKESNIKQEV